MHPRQIRDTSRPVLPSFTYCMWQFYRGAVMSAQSPSAARSPPSLCPRVLRETHRALVLSLVEQSALSISSINDPDRVLRSSSRLVGVRQWIVCFRGVDVDGVNEVLPEYFAMTECVPLDL